MSRVGILFVTTDEEAVGAVRRFVVKMDSELCVAGSLQDAAKEMAKHSFDLVLIQIDAPGGLVRRRLADGLIFAEQPPVVAVSRKASIRDAVQAVRAGARDYVVATPEDARTLETAVRRALSTGVEARGPGETEPPTGMPFRGFIAVDRRVLAMCRTLAAVADSDVTLLLQGESGTGKSLLAEKLHENSPRHLGPLVEVNCGPLTDAQVEMELFGYGDGSGAAGHDDGRGAFEQADGGTLLLGEVDHVGPALQEKLLRAVDTGEFERAGSSGTTRSDVRIIVASSPPANHGAAQGLFQRALRRRGSSVTVRIPPLRERIVDVPPLARHFLGVAALKHGLGPRRLLSEAMSDLVRYPWPGNVRELRDAMEYAALSAQGEAIGPEDLPAPIAWTWTPDQRRPPVAQFSPLKSAMREPERQHILHALRASRWNKLHAAKTLQISRSTLYKKIREHGLEQEITEAADTGIPDDGLENGVSEVT
jgi:DNA-binding NtrC family response regulator